MSAIRTHAPNRLLNLNDAHLIDMLEGSLLFRTAPPAPPPRIEHDFLVINVHECLCATPPSGDACA